MRTYAKPRTIAVASLCVFLALAIAHSSRPPTADCTTEELRLPIPSGNAFGDLWMPPRTDQPAAAVIVAHGYLANSRFMEVAFAKDLCNLRVAALFVDRRGHGRSDGMWRAPRDQRLEDLSPVVQAGIRALRARGDIDGRRIGLIGHSDGATEVLMAASYDWSIPFTVAIGASVAPFEYVNYVVPKNLLLLYGRQDTYVRNYTDELLLDAATRGELASEGQTGRFDDGSARRLERVAGAGHVDILFSRAARQSTLDWVATGLGIAPVRASVISFRWPVAGGLALLLIVLFSSGTPRGWAHWPARDAGVLFLAMIPAWSAGLFLVAHSRALFSFLPAQEVDTAVALLIIPATLIAVTRRAIGGLRAPRHPLAKRADLLRAAIFALGIVAGIELLATNLYVTATTLDRAIISAGLFLLALPAFWVVCSSCDSASSGITKLVYPELAVAVLTATLATPVFARMSALPTLVFALSLAFAGAYRVSRSSPAGGALVGAVVFARCVTHVCALY